MTDGPWLWLLAGPNGSGKSTYAQNLSSDVEEIVRPDELAYGLSPTAPESVAVRAGRLAISRIDNLLKERRSFRGRNDSFWPLPSGFGGARQKRWLEGGNSLYRASQSETCYRAGSTPSAHGRSSRVDHRYSQALFAES
jgi:hypothetical protein